MTLAQKPANSKTVKTPQQKRKDVLFWSVAVLFGLIALWFGMRRYSHTLVWYAVRDHNVPLVRLCLALGVEASEHPDAGLDDSFGYIYPASLWYFAYEKLTTRQDVHNKPLSPSENIYVILCENNKKLSSEERKVMLCQLARRDCLKTIQKMLPANQLQSEPVSGAMLRSAAKSHSFQVANWLLENGVPVDSANQGNTPLFYALYNNSSEMMEFLIARGADINARNENGVTPLMVAAVLSTTRHPFGTLLKHRAKVNEIDDFHRTALDYLEPDPRAYTILILEEYTTLKSGQQYHKLPSTIRFSMMGDEHHQHTETLRQWVKSELKSRGGKTYRELSSEKHLASKR